jgi:hypothetical protein
VTVLLALAVLPCLYWTEGIESAAILQSAGIERLCIPPPNVEAWRKAGFTVEPLGDKELAAREALPAPGIRARAGRASATRSPWVDANGWRLRRQPEAQYRYRLPAGTAPLAVAEAFVYGADAVLEVDPADLPRLGETLSFLRRLPVRELPDVADLAVVEDGTPLLGEVLNLLTRRNLLFRLVAEPSPQFRINVKLGTPEYPAREAADPHAFALKLRRQVGDEGRALHLFGSEVVIARLTGDGTRARLHLLNYSGREQAGLRIRLHGSYPEGVALVAGKGRIALEDRVVADGATEFTLPWLGPYGVVDLPEAN